VTEHRCLVATHAGLHVVRVSKELELIECTRLRRGHHYALSLRPDERRVYSKQKDAHLNVLAWDTLELVDTVPLRSSPEHVHQALVIDAGVLFTDTLHNRITFQPPDGEPCHFVIDGHESDVNHVNSLFLRTGGVAALLHNLGNGGSELLDLDFAPPSGFEVRQRRRFADTGCHNVFVEGDLLMFNASNAGAFVVHDLRTGYDIERFELGGHTKGLSATKEHLILGRSEVAAQADRGRCDSALVFLDRRDRSFVGQVTLRTAEGAKIGNVNEVRCLSQPDESEGSLDARTIAELRGSWWRELLGSAGRRLRT